MGKARRSMQVVVVARMVLVVMMMGGGVRVEGARGEIIRIGALVALKSSIGQSARKAIDAALFDVNHNPALLPNHTLALHLFDSGSNPIQAASAATKLLQEEVVAIVGPQASSGSHFMAHLASETQVPMLSFGVTEPGLSEYQYPYFLRVSHRDTEQMEAIASFVGHYKWKEVSLIYSNDEYSSNAIAALHNALLKKGSRLAHKVALDDLIDRKEVLRYLMSTSTRVFVIHMTHLVDGFHILNEAKMVGLMGKDSVWIVTDMIALSLGAANFSNMQTNLEGVIGIRAHIPKIANLERFGNAYALYAYDCVWIIAQAIDMLLKKGRKLEFQESLRKLSASLARGELSRLKKLKSGPILREEILSTRFHGISGTVEMNSRGDRKNCAFDFINLVGENALVYVGFWKNGKLIQLSKASKHIYPTIVKSCDESASSNSSSDIVWLGGSTRIPRGWEFSSMASPLHIGVPQKAGYNDLVSDKCSPENPIEQCTGFCIEVFKAALKHLPYSFSYVFMPYGNKSSTPVYDELIQLLANKAYDAVVGDVLITPDRLKIVDFTQPYIESGLVILAPDANLEGNAEWAFLKPFSFSLQLAMIVFSILIGGVIWIFEYKWNESFQGSVMKQLLNVLWYTYGTFFFIQAEAVVSFMGKAILVIWFFVVLIMNSSYTASLTSILTAQQFQPTIQGLQSLLLSKTLIGYPTGSFVRDFLISLQVDKERLKPLNSKDSYKAALSLGPTRGGVAAIVDESPYANLFLSAYPKGYGIVGNQEIQKGGWGFAFPKDSSLTSAFSEAIANMSNSGELKKIQSQWFPKTNDDFIGDTSNSRNMLDNNDFSALFLITGSATLTCLAMYFGMHIYKFRKEMKSCQNMPPCNSSSLNCIGTIKEFFDYVDQRHPQLNNALDDQKCPTRCSKCRSGLDAAQCPPNLN